MAKKALINRDLKRQALAKNMRLNAAIKAVINDSNATEEERFEARLRFQSIPHVDACASTSSLCFDRSPSWYFP